MHQRSALALFTLLVALLAGAVGATAANESSTPTPLAASGKTSIGANSPFVQMGTSFTYQGRLDNAGTPANGQYDLNFTLWDLASGGTQVGITVTAANQTVSNGIFTLPLDFGTSAFQGQQRWLQIAVRPSGNGLYTTLSPRQPVSPAPYAVSLVPGAVITGTKGGPILSASNAIGGSGVFGGSFAGYGVEGRSQNGDGVYGESSDLENSGIVGTHLAGGHAIRGENNSSAKAAIYGLNSGTAPSILGEGTTNTGVAGQSASGYGVYAASNTGYGLYASSTNGNAAVYAVSDGAAAIAVIGQASDGTGVAGYSTTYAGVYGSSDTASGAMGQSSSGPGVSGGSSTGYGVHGITTAGTVNRAGVYGEADAAGGNGVMGEANNGTTSNGVLGKSTGGYGVRGQSTGGYGIAGESSTGYGVHGSNTGGVTTAGVRGISTGSGGNGVIGEANIGSNAYGVWGKSANGYAGYFSGNVHVQGTLSKSAGSFKIDHPLDPANKYLSHSFVESPDMMNIYNGNVTTDAKGEAVVTMPTWFEALNNDFRYQLTVMGDQFAQARISGKMKDNRFTIKTDKPNIEVSWQVTGIRHDPYAEQYRIPVEQDKPSNERGYYLEPELYGQPSSKAIENSRSGAQNTQPGASTGK
jgi:hypothetical protein